ncbi:Transducin/WD40 repeat-like superfamily protein, partial [Prunus dulcis]
MKHASLSPSHRRCSAQPPPDALHRRIRWLHHLEIVPMAMLCGHAAPIADLGICDPLVVSGSEGRDSLGDGDGDGEVSSSPHSHGALISACADGMLCVWSRSSGHCRRRRKLPPWVGSPSMVRTLPSNQRLQLVSIPKNPHQDKEGGTGLHPSSQLEMTVCAEGLSEGGNVMSIATCGNVVAFVLKSRCIFRLLPSGNTIGEISSVDDLLCEKSDSTQSHMVGGLFLEIENVDNLPNTQESDEIFSRNFAVWNNKGLSIVYSISYSKGSVNGYDNDNLGLVNKRGVVSSSMVISETFFAPYAVVYGFFTGEIEIVRFDLFEGLSSLGGSSHHEVKPQISRQFFLGHTGAVLCLAAHRMVGIAKGWSFNQVLVSGSMDCTVRIWDLDTGNLITVMHQHVGPVRQIILPPAHTYRPWSDCFLSVGEDSCVALASLETLRVERIFPGHPSYPAKVVWDGGRGYIVCLCRNHSGTSDAVDILYIWDVKTGARERVLRGTPSHSMFDHFCKGISMNSISGSVLNGNTSVSSLLLPVIEDGISTHSHPNNSEKLGASTNLVPGTMVESNTSRISKDDSEKLFPAPAATLQSNKHPIKSYCPFPGIAALSFDLASLVFPYQKHDLIASGSDNKQDNYVKGQGSETSSPHHKPSGNGPGVHRTSNAIVEEIEWIKTLEECLLRFSLASLHLWNVDPELDNLLITDMKLKRPKSFIVASGFQGDKGSLTLTFPNLSATLETSSCGNEEDSEVVIRCESLCEIPANTHPLDVRLSISFIQMGHYILRIESLCFDAEEPLQWKPHVTIWSTCRKHDDHGNLCLWFKLHGVGCSLVDWTANSTSSNESECPGDMETKLTSSKSFVSSSGSVNGYDNDNLGLVNKRGVVSSSMVISETFFAPYAVVYGFFTGEIEIVRFDLFEGLSSLGGSSHHEVKPQISRQFFLGHTGAVLCLAAHRMVGIAKGWSFNQVLVSGSMDCTVRIWDLDTGNLITVMHQHVGPVRQIILPPAHTYRPWSDCFLSVGEDSCVALASLETLRVERIFPGHPSYPAKVVWDGGRGYIVCLCRNHSGTSDAVDILYIWDVKTGARERVLRGTPSHSMFDHFCKGISMNSISGSVLNGNTSVSSLLLPVIEDGISTHSHPNNSEKLGASTNLVPGTMVESNTSRISKDDSEKLFPAPAATLQSNKHPIKSYCPFPGIAALSFDLASLVFPYQKHDLIASGSDNKQDNYVKGQGSETSSPHHKPSGNGPGVHRTSNAIVEEIEWIKTLEECLLRFSLASLHLWNVDPELDNLLITDMKLKRPKSFIVASGFQGDKGSLTLTFPNLSATLELLVSFWQDESEHVRMAARSLFHCAASRAIPLPLCNQKASGRTNLSSLSGLGENEHLVMAMNEKYSSTAAELLAEGMESTWKQCISSEIPRLIGDIFFQIECVSGPSVNSAAQSLAVPVGLREILVGVLLPSLAVADVPGFLTVMESQIWSTASDSPVHLVSLMTLIRVVRGSPRYLAQYLDKVIDFILQTVDPSNSVMRNTCFQSSMTALKEVVRAFPMVALNDTWTRLAVGDVIGERNNATIRIYDMQSVMKIKVLDASGPPGLPNLLAAGSEMMLITAISALSFSPDGEGLVAFSEHGLMIRWWSLGSVFWEKLSRNLVPVQCTKLIFVPPWEGFSPNSSRSSIMASIMGHDRQINIQEGTKGLSQADNLKLLIHNLDLSYRLEWVGERKVLLTRHGHELGTFRCELKFDGIWTRLREFFHEGSRLETRGEA